MPKAPFFYVLFYVFVLIFDKKENISSLNCWIFKTFAVSLIHQNSSKMKTEEFIAQELSRIQDRITMLSREYNNKRVKRLNERGTTEYLKCIDCLRDAMNALKVVSVNIDPSNQLIK